MSASLTKAREARTRVIADHERLRGLMRQVLANAHGALFDEKLRGAVREGLTYLREQFEDHLDYEELVLVPLLKEIDAWSPEHAARMAQDHAGQRAVIAALAEDALDGVRSMRALADEVAWFVQSIEHDMREEETSLLGSRVLSDDTVAVG